MRNKIQQVLVGILLVVSQVSCSVLLDFTECESGSDCDSGVCQFGICTASDSHDVRGVIGTDTTWKRGEVYRLRTLVTIAPSVTLTIEPGVTILGDRFSALVGRVGSQIIANGTREEPIVFTSAKPEGERLSGDWGGVAILGSAPVNRKNATLNILPDEADAQFGGSDSSYKCGEFSYIRIEFGGGRVAEEEALNGMTFAGCGTGTVVDRLHVHSGGDDGLELFGGTLNLTRILVTRMQDDGLDIDLGWTGTMQFLAVFQDAGGQNAIEVDNLGEDPLAKPETDFQIYNYTLIAIDKGSGQRGMTFKDGGYGFMSHGIVMGHALEALDVYGVESGEAAMAGKLVIRDTMFYDIGPALNGGPGEAYFPIAGTEGESGDGEINDDDGGFEEDKAFLDESFNNLFGVDPQIESGSIEEGPSWVPSGAATQDVEAPPTGFDKLAGYRGAFAPNQIPWTEGWTAYPVN